MSKTLQAVRGMNDLLPAQIPYWHRLENALSDLTARYGYQEIRFPIVESTTLFKRTIGDATDIVEKEMYTFEDRNGDSLSLRPEGTAGCVRAGIQHGLLYNQIQRLWYSGSMFRHERPQKGRYRQFYQFGIEAFGIAGPDIDAEQILMMARLWQELGIADHVVLQINSLGTSECRAQYRERLAEYLGQHDDNLDEDSKRRMLTNPMRILDSKNPAMQEIVAGAPLLTEHLDELSQQHFAELRAILDSAGLSYEINPRLVRGLDYYGKTVYEWVTDQLGAQGAICAGGRYDSLVEQLGGKPTPGVGFAMGYERVIALLQAVYEPPAVVDAYLILPGSQVKAAGLLFAEKIRDRLPHLRLQTGCGEASLKSEFKRADKSGATIALIIGEAELAQNLISVKYLREDKAQQQLNFDQLADFLLEK